MREYDVSISFAGEQREYAENIAKRLSECGLRVFLDSWNIARMWGKDLTDYLGGVFSEKSLFVIAIFSKEYVEKAWPKFEFEAMQERRLMESEYILPITYDGVFPKNWPSTRGYIDARRETIDRVVTLVREKVLYYEDIQSGNIYNEVKEKPTMNVTNEKGEVEVVDVIVAFELKDNKKEYIVYSKNERDAYGDITVYVSRVDRNLAKPRLLGVDDEDWPRIKEVLWELSNDETEMSDIRSPLKSLISEDGVEIL